MKMSKKSKVILYILLTIVAVYFLAPFVYMLLTTFKTEGEAIAYPPSLFPKDWHFENYGASSMRLCFAEQSRDGRAS